MTPKDFQKVFLFVRDWFSQTLAAHAQKAKSVASFNFPRLSRYYSNDLLAGARSYSWTSARCHRCPPLAKATTVKLSWASIQSLFAIPLVCAF